MRIRLWIAIAAGVAIMATATPAGAKCVQLPDGTWTCVPDPPVVARPSQRPIPGVCRIAVQRGRETVYGSGALVWRGSKRAVVLSVQHLFRGRRGRVIVTFPNGEQYEAERVETNAEPDLGAVVIPRPNVEPVPIFTDDPQPGEQVTFCGYGPGGQYRSVTGTLRGYGRNTTGKAHDLIVTGAARMGDSGGPMLNQRGELVGVIWGTDGTETRGAFNGRVCQFVNTDRYALPWNAEVEQERIRADAGAYAPPPAPLVPVAPPSTSGPAVDTTARQMAQAALDRIGALAKEIEEADAAIGTATDAAEQAATIAAEAAGEAQAATEDVTTMEGGLRDRIKERIKEGVLPIVAAKIKEAGVFGAGGVGIALVVLYLLIKKDIRNRAETGDPLAIEKLAARTPWSFDDKVASAVADRLQARHESGGVDLSSLAAQLKDAIGALRDKDTK